MNINEVLSIIVCPVCKCALVMKDGLDCPKCGKKYYIQNGVPVLLAKDYKINDSLSRNVEFKSKLRNSGLFKRLKYIFGADFIPYDPMAAHKDIIFGKGRRVLNLGSGSKKFSGDVLNVDRENYPNVDVVADGCFLPFLNETFDAVLLEDVLQHVKYPNIFVDELKRVLRKGGTIYIVAPFVSCFCAYPSDFQRYTLEGLRALFEDFSEVESGVYRGPSVALINVMSDYFAGLFPIKNKDLNVFIKSVFTLFVFPIKYLDMLLVKRKFSHVSAHSLFYIGRK